jgi:hypothetical protein
MRRLPVLIAGAIACACSSAAQAGIVFTPHVDEYSRLPSGQYTEFTFIGTEIEHIYDRNGRKIQLGEPFVPPGDSTDAALALIKYLWVGNIFRDSDVPFLNTHPQFCRAIGTAGYQQNTGAIAARARLFGERPGANGVGDLYGLCGIYGDNYRFGPLQFNGLFGTTVKFPVGEYDTDAALNIGTHYWSVIPQLAFHSELYGRLFTDASASYQWNGTNDSPSFGGLTPTRPAPWWTGEINFAWKFTEHWYTDIGLSHRASIGPNHFDKVTINFKDQPLSPDSACATTNAGTGPTLGLLGLDPLLNPQLCDNPLLQQFYLKPQSRDYEDRGIRGTMVTAGVTYIYRTSSVLQARVAMPIQGRGSQIDTVFDVCAQACTDGNGDGKADNSISTVTTTLFGVQEAAAVSASPYLELRYVYLFWAP